MLLPFFLARTFFYISADAPQRFPLRGDSATQTGLTCAVEREYMCCLPRKATYS